MSHRLLFDQLVIVLKEAILPLGEDVCKACTAVLDSYDEGKNVDKIVAELSTILDGDQSTLLEQIRDMGYNIEGKPLEGSTVRAFQYMNETLEQVPAMGRYGVGAFLGGHLPTVVDLRCCNPTLSSALFEDVTGLQELYLPSCCGRVPAKFLANSSIQYFEGLETYLIGPHAFYGCKELRTVKVGALSGVDDSAFAGCGQLKVDKHFLYMVAFIGKQAFAASGVEEIKCSMLTYVGDRAFEQMQRLTKASLNITELPPYLFYDCRNLTTVMCPLAKKIGPYALSKCSMLAAIELRDEVTLHEYAFYSSGIRYIRLIKPTFSGIGHFEQCTSLEEICFGESPVAIPMRFCYSCTRLKYVTTDLPAVPGSRAIVNDEVGSLYLKVTDEECLWQFFLDGADTSVIVDPRDCVKAPVITSVGTEAFSWCQQLEEFDLWPTKRIGVRAFRHSGLKKAITRGSLGMSVFALCPNLSFAYLPTQKILPSHCFTACPKLGPIRVSAEEIGAYAFAGCENTLIELDVAEPCYIGAHAFAQTMFTNIRIGDNSHIGSYAFYQTRKVSKEGSVVIGSNVRVTNRAFSASDMTAVTIGKRAAVSDYAFQRCKSLKLVVSDTGRFGQAAFSECKQLSNFVVTRPVVLPTRLPYALTQGTRTEMFTRSAPKISLLSTANLDMIADLLLDKASKKTLIAAAMAISRLGGLPQELFLEIVYSLILRSR